MAADLASSLLNTAGAIPLPVCAPLHHGCLSDLPQAHHAYVFPSSKSAICGALPAACGFSIITGFSCVCIDVRYYAIT